MESFDSVLIYLCLTILVTRVVLGNTNISCNFEVQNCAWESNEKWQNVKAYKWCDPCVPDHTTNTDQGSYMRLQTWNMELEGSLVSPQIVLNKPACLSFWYYVKGSSINSFQIQMRPNMVFSINVSQQNMWYLHLVNINYAGLYTVKLKAEFIEISNGNGEGRCILVDDIIQEDGLCTCTSSTSFRTTANTINNSLLNLTTVNTTTGIIIGVVFSIGFIVGLVALLMFFVRRAKFVCKKSANTTMLSNDYTGHQSVALPTLPNPISNIDGYAEIQTKSDNYQHVNANRKKLIDASGRYYAKPDKSMQASNSLQANNATNYDYIYSDKTAAGATQTSFHVPGANMFGEETHKSNDYAIINPNNYNSSGIDKDIKHPAPPLSNYAILDPNETGFFRSKGNNKTNTEYDFAVPINDHERVSDVQDTYTVSENGTYDTTDQVRHKEAEINIYSRAVDNVYDTSSHERKIMANDGTYDRFFGNETEDNYNTTKRE